MSFYPVSPGRWTFRKGMAGWDVEAIQVAINATGRASKLVADGVFGALTDSSVRSLQSSLGILADGICGPETQEKACRAEWNKAEKGLTPRNLVVGTGRGESGFQWACTSALYVTKTRDFGSLQNNKPDSSSEDVKRAAYNIVSEGLRVARAHNARYIHFNQSSFPVTSASKEKAWKIALLDYNWPAAAEHLALGTATGWTYKSNDGKWYDFDQPSPWITQFKIPGVETGRQWCSFYIATKVGEVTSWAIST